MALKLAPRLIAHMRLQKIAKSEAPPTMSISLCMLNFKCLYLRNGMG